MPSAEFNKAWEEVKTLKEEPDQNNRLKLYAYGKIANGANFEEASKPSFYDLKAKYKYNAWKEELDNGVDQKQADKEYIALVKLLFKKQKEKEQAGTSA